MKKIIRSTTVASSLDTFCNGLLKELSKEYEVIALSSPEVRLDKVGIREGIRTISVPMERRIAIFKDLKSLLLLICNFYKERPDIVHSMTPKAGLLCMIASWVCRVPIRIHTFTGLVFPTAEGLQKKILMLTDWLTCACATHIIPEGEGVKTDLLINGITRKPLKVLGHGNVRGIDLKYYDRSPEVMEHTNNLKDPDFFSFIFIGRIVRDKGINELIEAFTRLNKENDRIRLILVGPYEDCIDPVSDVTRQEINFNHNIITVGRQNDVRPWLAASDALVFPSYREGFPNVVIEAGAMGIPSIVTNINGSREIILEGENGVIVPPRDIDSLYFAMKRFCEEPDFVAALSKKARQMIASRYEQGFVRKCLINFYSEILTKTNQTQCIY